MRRGVSWLVEVRGLKRHIAAWSQTISQPCQQLVRMIARREAAGELGGQPAACSLFGVAGRLGVLHEPDVPVEAVRALVAATFDALVGDDAGARPAPTSPCQAPAEHCTA